MNRQMKMHEIVQLLNRSAGQIDNATADKLLSARRNALQYRQTARQAPVLAWLSQHCLIHHSAHGHKALNWGMAGLAAAILLCGALYWQHSYERDHAEIDIAILTDDLPVDMYVD